MNYIIIRIARRCDSRMKLLVKYGISLGAVRLITQKERVPLHRIFQFYFETPKA